MAEENRTAGGEGNATGGKRRYYRRRKSSDQSSGERSGAEKERSGKSSAPDSNENNDRSAGGRNRLSGRRRVRRSRKEKSTSGSGSNNSGNSNSSAKGATESPTREGRRSRSSSRTERGERPENSRRSRTRRRRSTATPEPAARVQTVYESTIDTIAHEYDAPKSVFVYTHISRPSYGGMNDYRTEHFPRIGRKLEDFAIDISALFDEEGNMHAPGTFRRAEERVDEHTYSEGDWEDEND
jgi:hypothetical protein